MCACCQDAKQHSLAQQQGEAGKVEGEAEDGEPLLGHARQASRTGLAVRRWRPGRCHILPQRDDREAMWGWV